MDKERQIKLFLEQQLEWCNEQDRVFVKIEKKLHEMKEIAQYTLVHELSTIEIEHSNNQINQLKEEVHSLEAPLTSSNLYS